MSCDEIDIDSTNIMIDIYNFLTNMKKSYDQDILELKTAISDIYELLNNTNERLNSITLDLTENYRNFNQLPQTNELLSNKILKVQSNLIEIVKKNTESINESINELKNKKNKDIELIKDAVLNIVNDDITHKFNNMQKHINIELAKKYKSELILTPRNKDSL